MANFDEAEFKRVVSTTKITPARQAPGRTGVAPPRVNIKEPARRRKDARVVLDQGGDSTLESSMSYWHKIKRTRVAFSQSKLLMPIFPERRLLTVRAPKRKAPR